MTKRLGQYEAQAILDACGVPIGEDYHALSSRQVDALLAEARKRNYRKPATASGSTGRYFHARLVRAARDRPISGWISGWMRR